MPRRFRSTGLLMSALLALASPLPAHAQTEVTFRTISRAVVPSHGDRLDYLVARSRVDWDRVWKNRGPHPDGAAQRYVPAPTLEFGTEMAVGVLGASQLNHCAAVTITRVVQEANHLRVDYEPWPAPSQEECRQEPTTPFHVVAIPASPLPVRFAEAAPR